MFMALLTAYNVLLACYSSEEDLVCGLPYAGRSRAETEGMPLRTAKRASFSLLLGS